MQKSLTPFLSLLFLLIISGCNNTSPENPPPAPVEKHEVIGVSVWDRISTRSEARRKSASTTLLSLGESFLYLDTFAIDSSYNNTKFLKARLSDSSEVWVYGFASVLDAKPAVITTAVPLYLRPDLLTISDKRVGTMEIVAVTEEWDKWIKVVNEKKEKVGWIKEDFISYNTIDLAFALLAKRTLEKEDPEERIKMLEELLENNPYPGTVFISELKDKLEQEKQILRESRNDREWDNENRNNRSWEEENRRRRNN